MTIFLKINSFIDRNSGLEAAAFTELHNSVKRGDVVGIEGYPGKSKRGELSIFPTRFVVLSPCLHMLPVAHTGLKSQVGGTELHQPVNSCKASAVETVTFLNIRAATRLLAIVLSRTCNWTLDADIQEIG